MDRIKEYDILLIDDNIENIEFLEEALNPLYNISASTSGNTGYKIAIEKKPDLILLDIIMPDLDGYQVCEMLKTNSITSSIPVIFLTGKKELNYKTRGFELGAADYITKPFEIVEIKARVKNQLMVRRAEKILKYQNIYLENEINFTKAELESSEKKFRLLYEQSITAIAFAEPIFNESGQLIDFTYMNANSYYLNIFSLQDKNEIIGRNETEILPGISTVWFDQFRKTPEKVKLVNLSTIIQF